MAKMSSNSGPATRYFGMDDYADHVADYTREDFARTGKPYDLVST